MIIETTGVQQGWQCPVCKRIYSPFTVMCYYCPTTTTIDTGTTSENPNKYQPHTVNYNLNKQTK